jgi:hypothetical protein
VQRSRKKEQTFDPSDNQTGVLIQAEGDKSSRVTTTSGVLLPVLVSLYLAPSSQYFVLPPEFVLRQGSVSDTDRYKSTSIVIGVAIFIVACGVRLHALMIYFVLLQRTCQMQVSEGDGRSSA